MYRTPQGSCYNRDTLEQWFQTMPSDPLTRQALEPHPDFASRPRRARAPRSTDVYAAIAQDADAGVALVLPVIPEYYSTRSDAELMFPSVVRSVAGLVAIDDDPRVYSDLHNFAEAVRLLDIHEVALVKFTRESLAEARDWFRTYGSAYQALDVDRSHVRDTFTEQDIQDMVGELRELF